MSARGAAARSRAAGRPAPSPAPAPAPRPGRRPAPPTHGRAARRRGHLRRGSLAVPLIALALGGIVWVNVATLGLTTQTGQVAEEARGVEAELVRLRGQAEERNAAIDELARERLGMIDAPADSVRFLDLAPANPSP